MKKGTAIIIGAGPAGLTAAIELQRHSGIKPVLRSQHSMLTAMTGVENIINGVTTRENIWAVNTEMDITGKGQKSDHSSS